MPLARYLMIFPKLTQIYKIYTLRLSWVKYDPYSFRWILEPSLWVKPWKKGGNREA